MQALTRYTLEVATPAGGWQQLQQATERARKAGGEMRDEGIPVRFLRAVFVPEDETCFFLFEGPTATAVRDAAHRAQLGAGQVRRTITDIQEER